jgi:hypothetical protein
VGQLLFPKGRLHIERLFFWCPEKKLDVAVPPKHLSQMVQTKKPIGTRVLGIKGRLHIAISPARSIL